MKLVTESSSPGSSRRARARTGDAPPARQATSGDPHPVLPTTQADHTHISRARAPFRHPRPHGRGPHPESGACGRSTLPAGAPRCAQSLHSRSMPCRRSSGGPGRTAGAMFSRSTRPATPAAKVVVRFGTADRPATRRDGSATGCRTPGTVLDGPTSDTDMRNLDDEEPTRLPDRRPTFLHKVSNRSLASPRAHG